MALKPVADRVIVKYFETEDKTASEDEDGNV